MLSVLRAKYNLHFIILYLQTISSCFISFNSVWRANSSNQCLSQAQQETDGTHLWDSESGVIYQAWWGWGTDQGTVVRGPEGQADGATGTQAKSCGCGRGGPALWSFPEGRGKPRAWWLEEARGQRLTSRFSPFSSTASPFPSPSGHQRARQSSNRASNARSADRSRWRGPASGNAGCPAMRGRLGPSRVLLLHAPGAQMEGRKSRDPPIGAALPVDLRSQPSPPGARRRGPSRGAPFPCSCGSAPTRPGLPLGPQALPAGLPSGSYQTSGNTDT